MKLLYVQMEDEGMPLQVLSGLWNTASVDHRLQEFFSDILMVTAFTSVYSCKLYSPLRDEYSNYYIILIYYITV